MNPVAQLTNPPSSRPGASAIAYGPRTAKKILGAFFFLESLEPIICDARHGFHRRNVFQWVFRREQNLSSESLRCHMPIVETPVSLSVEKILFATDFSSSSEKAAPYAKTLARRFASTVEVAHMFDPSFVTTYDEAALGIPAPIKRKMSNEALERVRSDFADSGIKVRAVTHESHFPAADLLKIAKEDNVDLIVAGTSSRKGLDRLILGSTAEHLIRNAPCPVLTIGPNVAPSSEIPSYFQRIVYATDFSPEAAKAAIFALSFAEDGGAKLVLCYVQSVNTSEQEVGKVVDNAFTTALRQLVPETSYDGCNPEFVVEHGEAAKAILDLANRVNADLIVLGARKSSFWLTHGGRGVTPKLLAQARCPVLTVC
jgi:nucleotide-binding universal stress UspA family protein